MRRPLLLLFVLAATVAAQDDVTTTVKQLKDAFKSKDETVIEPVIREAGKVDDDKVAKEIAKGLRNKSLAVRRAAITTLGHMKSPVALKELHRLYNGNRALSKNPELFAMLLKEIGRHGDKSSIKVLTDSVFRNLTVESGTARLRGLGNIRHKDAVEALVKLSRKSSGKQRGSGVVSEWRGVFIEAFDDSIYILTGQDYGRGQEDLEKWWRENKKKLKIDPKHPKVPDEISRRWAAYWQDNYYEDAKDAPPPQTFRPPVQIVENPTPDQEKVAVDGLKDAFSSKDPDAISNALEHHGGMVSDKVVHEVARGLRYRDRKVRMIAVKVLGWTPSKAALKQLHRMYRREKDLGKKDEALFAQLLKEIGRHGNKGSITVLSDKPFKYHTLASSRARIMGLGNIRKKDSVETLIKGMRLTGTSGARDSRSFRQDAPRAMPEFNVALTVLTGDEMGEAQEPWQKWWRDNKRKFKMSPERPKVSDKVRRRWETYWNEKY
ncbi:MAG: HEAT repeat domain-containing protein [Planctomycetota bacterium]|jgi:HEAT repeat protein